LKWFKHEAAFSESDAVRGIERYFGLPGYARLMKLFEAVAKRMDASDRCDLVMTWSQIETLLAGKRRSLQSFFDHLVRARLIRLSASDQQCSIQIPQLLEWRDNHTRNFQATDKPTAKSAKKNTSVLFDHTDQWTGWLRDELCYTERQVNIPEHCRIMRQWVASNVTTREVEEALDQAVLEGIDIKQLANLHRLVAQERKRRIEEARQ